MKYLRIPLLITLIIALLVLGYLRERYLLVFNPDTIFSLLKKYPRISVTNFKNEVSNFWLFRISPKLLSSILYSLAFAMLASLIVLLSTKNKFLGYLTLSIYGGFMLVCFILIAIGNMGVDYHLSYGLSHDIEDLFLSPLIFMMIVSITYFQRIKIR